MAKAKRGAQSGKKGGSIIDNPIEPQGGKKKGQSKKPRKQSRGK